MKALWMFLPIGFALVFGNGPAAMAQTAQEFTAACQADITKHCGPAAASPQGLQACLAANKASLADACKKIVDGKK
ncbi:MAG: hypothetical protein LCH61_18910 [Proteobacteria bacterium]|nr:hypothetical protein [Pseudomonadota bacterium]